MQPKPSLPLFFLLSAFVFTLFSVEPRPGEWTVLEGARLDKKGYHDGDSFHVRYQGEDYVFRLFYVDAPETDERYPDRIRGQAKYFGISADETLEAGEDATRFAEKFLSGTFTVYTDWTDGWGRGTRYRAIFVKDGEELGAALVGAGLARNSGFVPDTSWPGLREDVWEYRKELEKLENRAKRENRGAWGFRQDRPAPSPDADSGDSPKPTDSLVDLNSASGPELEKLPRIGPVLAGRIIEARPFFTIEELAQVSGISFKTIDGLRSQARVIPPPIQPNTALYYKENARFYLNRLVRVVVESLQPLDDWAPAGYSVAEATTANLDTPGGTIRLFAPTPNMNYAIERFKQSPEPLDVRARLRDYEGEIILVVDP